MLAMGWFVLAMGWFVLATGWFVLATGWFVLATGWFVRMECGAEHADQPVEALVDVERDAEAARGFQGGEAVEGAAQGPDGMDRVVALEAVAGEDRQCHRSEER